MPFKLESPFAPAGGQPEAIARVVEGFSKGKKLQTLLGITGSGKTFVMANVIAALGKPTLVLAHNKTLAAQLYQELRSLFPENRVEYFISYYDYYQPESYLPTSDTYIEKEATINEQIEKMRLKATASLMSRDDVIVVASISCIYGLGDPGNFNELALGLERGKAFARDALVRRLLELQYERADALEPGKFRVKGDVIDIYPAYDDRVIRVELDGETIERLTEFDHITGSTISTLSHIRVFPAKQFVVPEEKQQQAIAAIQQELAEWAPSLPELERQRLSQRVKYDLEMLHEVGYCSGIENYSRHFDGRVPGTPPYVLLNYFPSDFLLIIDESHQTIPQAHGMYKGDYARKKNLVEYGFRLPCAFDNRPLKFEEFETYFKNVLFVSATPAAYEREKSKQVVELIIRPTGLLDPEVEVRKSKGQIQDLLNEISRTISDGDRVLVTTLTKRMAEDLTEYLSTQGVRVRYLHSEIESLDRIELIRGLRAGEYDVLVGINLLREGLDLPEVALIAILDADKEGFLRNDTSLIQTIGRASRNVRGRVIMYADTTTQSMERAITITRRRRREQITYNAAQGITPQTIIKAVAEKTREIKGIKHLPRDELLRKIADLDAEMRIAAEQLDFERAIELRDALRAMQDAAAEEMKR